MTSFLRINGIEVPVMNDEASLSQEDLGSYARAEDGTPMFNRRATKRTWSFRTTIQLARTALAFRDLITGKGHVVNFDNSDFYSSKGLAPTSVGAGWSTTTSSPKYGAAMGASTSAGTNLVYTPFTSTSPYTVAYWFYPSGGPWAHYIYRSDGSAWVNGVLSGSGLAACIGLTGVTSGVVTFAYSGAASNYDDIVLLPTYVPDDWPAQMYAWGNTTGQPFSALPRLTADGLMIEQNARVSVKGAAGELRARQARFSGVITPNAQDFAFGLLEV